MNTKLLHVLGFTGLGTAIFPAFAETSQNDPTEGLRAAHRSVVDPSDNGFLDDLRSLRRIGEVTALIPEASTADESSENSIDGQSGDTDFPFSTFKPLATVGEYDPNTGMVLTGYPDGNAAWLVDNDTIRVAYQSESYGTNFDSETYPWVMSNGVKFTGSQIHFIDYDRSKFANFLETGIPASDMFECSGHLFDTVYNVFGEEVLPRFSGGKWGNQTLPDGTIVDFKSDKLLSEADFFFQSFCGSHFEQANRYGDGIGFADDIWFCAEEWNIQRIFDANDPTTETMGLASLAVDVKNKIAYTVPALGQSGYEKLLPMNPGHPDYVVVICAGYNFDLPADTAPLKVYVGKKGLNASGNPIGPDAPERDKFLARNGLLYGKLYGMALANSDFATLNVTADPDGKALDEYVLDATAPDTFNVRYYPTSYQWSGFDNPVAVKDTEVHRWLHDGDNGEPNEQPAGYTFFTGDDKTEHPAVDPDITKFRYVQNLTEEGALLGIDFTNMIAELTATEDLPEFLSANVRRIVSAVDGSLTLETRNKGISHDGVTTASVHVEKGAVAKMVAPDGLQWIKSADADVLIIDEDSGNDYGERKYALVLNPDTLELAEDNTGYFLAMAGGSKNPRALNGVAAYPGTHSRATSAEFSGSWNVTGMVARKPDGNFWSPEELAGTGMQAVASQIPLSEQTLIGVVQHRSESGGPTFKFRADAGGQVFMFNICLPTAGLMMAHRSDIDSSNSNFASDVTAVKTIGQITAPIPEAGTAGSNGSFLVDGQAGDQDYPFINTLKVLATVGEADPKTGLPLTGYPDGNAAWLHNDETIRVAYQSESYGTIFGSETYPWIMKSGVEFTGSHIHYIDYDRSQFADFLSNNAPASEMFKQSGHIFDTVYNVFGAEVTSKDLRTFAEGGEASGKWGNQTRPDGTYVEFEAGKELSDADFFFQSFCGSHFEKIHKYGDGIGFEDEIWFCAEEWNIQRNFDDDKPTTETMGLASIAVDVKNGVAYTVPALGQSGYEKLLPMNSGHPDYVVVICAGYNFNLPSDTAPLKVYVGKKGLDSTGNPVSTTASERDQFLARNGLLYGKLYGMALANEDFATLGITNPDPDNKLMDDYLKDESAPDTFSVRYYPTSYQWSGFDTPVAVIDTEITRWFLDGDQMEGATEPNEQPAGYTYFNGDGKTEHPAVDPDITKFRYVQNMTDEGALLGIDFTNMVAELTATEDLPEYLSANVRRIIAAVDGAMTLEVGSKGLSHDGVTTASTHVEDMVASMVDPDGLQWIRSSDADILIVDEDSGNDFGERKYALVLNPETLELAEDGKGYFLAMAGGSQNPRALADPAAAAYPGTASRNTSSEFSGSWNVTAFVKKKSDGSFWTKDELAGPAEQAVNELFPLSEQTIQGVVQHRSESGGAIFNFRSDAGGQVFLFDLKNIATLGGLVTFDLGSRGSQGGDIPLEQAIRAGQTVMSPTVQPADGWSFVGWDQSFDSVNGNLVVTAQYVKDDTINDFGLFTGDQLQGMAASPSVAKGPNGEVSLTLDLLRSQDLNIFSPYMLNTSEHAVSIENGAIKIELSDDTNAAFYQFSFDAQ